jgi:DNA-binding transcriptional ArsR family regulator
MSAPVPMSSPPARVEYEADSVAHDMAQVPRTTTTRRPSARPSRRASRARLVRDVEEQWCQLSSAMARFQSQRAEQRGLTLNDLQAVDILARDEAVCASALADECGLTRGAITGLLDRLERAGLARRSRDDDDGRRLVIRSTEDRPGCDCRVPRGLREVVASFDEASLREIRRFLEEGARALRHDVEGQGEDP